MFQDFIILSTQHQKIFCYLKYIDDFCCRYKNTLSQKMPTGLLPLILESALLDILCRCSEQTERESHVRGTWWSTKLETMTWKR